MTLYEIRVESRAVYVGITYNPKQRSVFHKGRFPRGEFVVLGKFSARAARRRELCRINQLISAGERLCNASGSAFGRGRLSNSTLRQHALQPEPIAKDSAKWWGWYWSRRRLKMKTALLKRGRKAKS